MADLRCQETFVEPSAASSCYGGRGTAYSTPLVCRAYRDPVILDDLRVFHNMLGIEDFYVAASNYFDNNQTEIKPHMRKIVTDWMLEVCLDQNCHADVFLLSCNIMDRFLSIINIKKNQFQLVAASTIFIASKLVDPCPISASELIKYTDNTYKLTELLEMELLILSKLKWDLSAITPYDFLEYLLRLLCTQDTNINPTLLRRSTENFIVLCATEFRFSMYPPSMLSSAALAAAATNLDQVDTNLDQQLDQQLDNRNKWRSCQVLDNDGQNSIVKHLQLLTGVELECLLGCVRQIEDTFKAASESVNSSLRHNASAPTNENALKNNPANENRINNNPTNPQSVSDTIVSGSSVTEADDSSDSSDSRKSHTPTEVFNVDWLCVA